MAAPEMFGDASALTRRPSPYFAAPGARLGMKKETLSRLLRQFAADGVIAVAQRRVAILDRARLRRPPGG